MRDLELNPDDDETPRQPDAVSNPPSADLSEAHEMLLHEVDEVRRLVRELSDQMQSLEMRLSPTEGALTRQSAMLERVAREVLAETTREWAQTAARYRKFVEDQGSLAAWQQQRVVQATDPRRPFRAALLGGFLAGMLVLLVTLLVTMPWATTLKNWVLGVKTAVEAPATTATPPETGSPATKKTAKPGTR